MIEIATYGACGNEFKTDIMFAPVFFHIPVFPSTLTFPHRRMVRKEIVMNKEFDHFSLPLTEYTSRGNISRMKHVDVLSVLDKDISVIVHN